MLTCIDLFSGIGGLSHALHGFVTPILYCDIWPPAQQALTKLMRDGRIPTAPIHGDIATLTDPPEADVMCFGFPCVGMSSAGKRKGLENPQSKLFYEAMRIVAHMRPKFCFVENVRGLLSAEGAMSAVTEKFQEMEYDLRWMCLPATAVGAPHKRMRWFGLAVRTDLIPSHPADPLFKLHHEGTYTPATFQDPPARTKLNPTREDRLRNSLLGNAVVPDQARFAFLTLWTGQAPTSLNPTTPLTLCDSLPGWRPIHTPTSYPVCGHYSRGEVHSWKGPRFPPAQNLDLTLDPKAYTSPNPPPLEKMTSGWLTEPVRKKLWPTPVHSHTGSSQFLTKRCCNMLHTAVRFEKDTPDNLREGQLNPEFTEHLMGYPRGWTELARLDSESE